MPAQKVPLEVHQARGSNGRTLGGREIDTREGAATPPSVRQEPPPVPDTLQERGRLEWQKVWQAGWWLWPDQDYAWVEQIAHAYDDIARFRATINEEGLTVQGYNGQTVAHPLIAEVRKAEQTIQKCLSTIGFSPTDRARLKLSEAKADKAARDLIPGSSPPPGTPVVQAYVEGQW